MSTTRKPADAREKDLRLALSRIQHGRAHTKETKVSVASVAREAGVSTSLIHNHYPGVAEAIRVLQGRSSRDQRDVTQGALKEAMEKMRALRREADDLRAKVAKLASINEVLQAEIRDLKARQIDPAVLGASLGQNDCKSRDH